MSVLDEVKKLAEKLRGKVDRDKSMPGTQFIPGGFKGGVQRVRQSFKQDPGQYSFTRAFANVVPATQKTLSPIRTLRGQQPGQFAKDVSFGLRGATQFTPFQAVNTLGLDRAGQGAFLRSTPQTSREITAQQIGRTVYGSALAAPIGGGSKALNVIRNMVAPTAFGATLSPVFQTIGTGIGQRRLPTRQELGQSVKTGAYQGFKSSPLLAFTNPLTTKVLSTLGGAMNTPVVRKSVGALANLIEDEILASSDNIEPELSDRIMSLALGAFFTKGSDVKHFRKASKLAGASDSQIKNVEVKAKALFFDKDGLFTGKFPESDPGFVPAGKTKPTIRGEFEPGELGLVRKQLGKSRLKQKTVKNIFGQDVPVPPKGQEGIIQLGPKPKKLKVKDQDVSLKEIIPEDLATEAKKYGSAEEFGTVREWGTHNQYLSRNPFRKQLDKMKLTKKFDEDILKKSEQWELEQVLKDKPAYLADSSFLSKDEIKKFAKKNKLWIRTRGDGTLVVAKDIDSLNRVLNATNQRELGLSLGYQDIYNQAKGKAKLVAPETKLKDLKGVEAHLRTETPAMLKAQAGVQATQKASLVDSSKAIVAPKDKYAFNINKKKLGLKGADAQKLDTVVEQMRPVLEQRKGKPLTDTEIIKGGRKAQMLDQVMGRDQAADFSKQLQATRNFVRTSSKQEGVTPEYLAQLDILSSTAADTGRKLRAFSINAEDAGIKELVLKDLNKLGIETQRLVDAAKGVDWDNAAQVTEFYRKFKPAEFGDRLTEFRYVNMLSSPNTHIINFFTNFLQTGIVAPIEKTLTGQLDWVRSKLTGTEQKYFAKQGVDYTKGYYKSFPEAWSVFKKTLGGEGGLTKPDVDFLPTSTSKLHKLYTTPLRALEAGDQFFRKLTEAGEIKAGSTLKEAQQSAEYRLFRQKFDPQGKLGQGTVLKTWDKWNSAVQNLRRAPGGKWLVPFLQTPTNILKQGVEYSPLGITTLHGSKKPMEQLAKTMIGTSMFTVASVAANAGLTTWDTPTNTKDKEKFYDAGLQPYSVKVGDKWVSYSKLGPLAYPIAMASAMKWASDNGADEGHLKKLGAGLVGMMRFFTDQSYVRGLGDWIDAARGDEYKMQRAITNIPSQLIPYRALQGWFARLVDPVYRKTKSPLESIKSQVPFLSKTLSPYETPSGEPSKRDFPLANAFLPAKVSQEKKFAKFRYDVASKARIESKATKIGNYIKENDYESVKKKYPREATYYSAEKIYSEINKINKNDVDARRAKLEEFKARGYTDPSVVKALAKIKELDKSGMTKSDRELVLFSNDVRAQKIISRFNGIQDKKRKKELLRLYKKHNIINKEVEEAIIRLSK